MSTPQEAIEAALHCAPEPVQSLTFCRAHPHEEWDDEGCSVAADVVRALEPWLKDAP